MCVKMHLQATKDKLSNLQLSFFYKEVVFKMKFQKLVTSALLVAGTASV